MPKLIFDNSERDEIDQSIIENLQRKGWNIVNTPEYDNNSQRLVFDKDSKEYLVIDLTSEEISAKKIVEGIINNQLIINQKISAGYFVNPEKFTLGLSDNDRDLFTQMTSLIREALDLGLITNDTPQTIVDINNQEITLSTLRFRQIMVGYGMYYKSLWDQME